MSNLSEEINRTKYIVCCPLCDNDKCCKGTDKCEAEIWAKGRKQENGKIVKFCN